MGKSYENRFYNQLARDKTGHDLPEIIRRIGPERRPREVADHISELLGRPFHVNRVRYLSEIADVPLRSGHNPVKNRGRGWKQQVLVECLTPYLEQVGIEQHDYPHVVYMMASYYQPDLIHLGDLVRVIGDKRHLKPTEVKDLYVRFYADVEVERFFISGQARLTRGVLRKMTTHTQHALASIKGRRIHSAVNINEHTTLLIFDDHMGVLIRPDTKLGNLMRIESPDRVRSHLEELMRSGERQIGEVSDILEDITRDPLQDE